MDSPFFIRVYQKTLEFSRVIDNILNNTELREYYSQFGVDFSIIIEPMNKILSLYKPLPLAGSIWDNYDNFKSFTYFYKGKKFNGSLEFSKFAKFEDGNPEDVFMYSELEGVYSIITKEVNIYAIDYLK